MMRLTAALADEAEAGEYAPPELRGVPPKSRAVLVSDFLGDLSGVEKALARASDRGITGAMVQVLDPQEEAFPFDGRTIFESVGGTLSHETLKARDLRDRYVERLSERKAALAAMAKSADWQFQVYHTDTAAASALLWLYRALERVH